MLKIKAESDDESEEEETNKFDLEIMRLNVGENI